MIHPSGVWTDDCRIALIHNAYTNAQQIPDYVFLQAICIYIILLIIILLIIVWGSLWFTGRNLFHYCLGVSTIFKFETIEIAWPTND